MPLCCAASETHGHLFWPGARLSLCSYPVPVHFATHLVTTATDQVTHNSTNHCDKTASRGTPQIKDNLTCFRKEWRGRNTVYVITGIWRGGAGVVICGMVSPPLNRHWHTLKIKIRACRSPSKDALILYFWHVIPILPERAWGGITERLPVPSRTNTQQCYQSIEKTGWVENLYSSLQFNISVN